MAISDCNNCKGTGWIGDVPCGSCNTRGKISDQLYDDELRKYPNKEKPKLTEQIEQICPKCNYNGGKYGQTKQLNPDNHNDWICSSCGNAWIET